MKTTTLKKPAQHEIIIAIILVAAWFYAMLVLNNYDVEKAGSITVGALVGVIFALFGCSATKSLKTALIIIATSFMATMVYNMVAGIIHYFY